MQQVRTFETLAWMVMKPSISKAAANCLGRLANSPGQAGIAAQVWSLGLLLIRNTHVACTSNTFGAIIPPGGSSLFPPHLSPH